jgi:hypothetical protein
MGRRELFQELVDQCLVAMMAQFPEQGPASIVGNNCKRLPQLRFIARQRDQANGHAANDAGWVRKHAQDMRSIVAPKARVECEKPFVEISLFQGSQRRGKLGIVYLSTAKIDHMAYPGGVGQHFKFMQELLCRHAIGGPDVMHGPMQLFVRISEERRALIVEKNISSVKDEKTPPQSDRGGT